MEKNQRERSRPAAGRRAAEVQRFLSCLLLAIFVAAPQPALPASLKDLIDDAKEMRESVFGSRERQAESLEGLPQWTRVLQETGKGQGALSACLADDAACSTASLRRWRAAVADARGLPRRQRLQVVNDFFNRWPHRSDRELYGLREYWATPREFMARSGDCEDYAIAKFFTLRALGFANDELRIVALHDRLRRMTHAVVTVDQSGKVLVLDSLTNLILPQDRYKHYVARFSVNETTRWDHFGSARPAEPTIFQRHRPGDS